MSFRVAEARARLGELLDAADEGRDVFIERRGVRYRLVAEPRPRKPRRVRPVITWADDAVLDGRWMWTWTREGVSLDVAKRR